MEDVTHLVFQALFLASSAIFEFAQPSRKRRAIGLLLYLAAGLVLYVRVHLPISRDAVTASFIAIGMCWVVFLAFFVPQFIRDIKAAARD